MHSYWLVILSTILMTPLYHHHDVSCYVAPFLAVPRPFNVCITKMGLIDLDDLTEEDTRHTCGMWHHCQGHSTPSVPSAKVAIVGIVNYPRKG